MEEKEDYIVEQTADGSHTLFVPSLNEHYHSVNGAVQESLHVFIHAGFEKVKKYAINVLEIGFGTGLNAFLTLKELTASTEIECVIYHAVELFPLDNQLVEQMNYPAAAWPEKRDWFTALHQAPWGQPCVITPGFTLYKMQDDARTCLFPNAVDLIYFDAFGPDKQPDMWEQSMFDRLYACMAEGGVFVTYCAKGEVRRRLQAAGFTMERLPGPPGKRHMLLGRKV